METGASTLLGWHWLAFGLVLIGAEMFVASFSIVWFGLAACLVGMLLLHAVQGILGRGKSQNRGPQVS